MNGTQNIKGIALILKMAAISVVLAGCACGDLPPSVAGMMKDKKAKGARVVSPRSSKTKLDDGTVYETKRGRLFVSRPGGSKVELLGQVGFAFDNALLPPKTRRLLRGHAQYLLKNPDKIVTIEGHCDERGTREYNLALGDLRARAVESYFRGRGVRGSQIKTISFGEEKPVDPGSNETAWSRNRRAIIIHQ